MTFLIGTTVPSTHVDEQDEDGKVSLSYECGWQNPKLHIKNTLK